MWRPRSRSEHLVLTKGHGRRKQPDTVCSARALLRGDCTQQRTEGSVYCYYHDKVQRGVVDTFRTTNSAGEWVDIAPTRLYLVYPLPASGYMLLGYDEEEAA